MENATQKIEEYLKNYFISQPAISKNETDILASNIVIMLKKDLSNTMFKAISNIMKSCIAEAMLEDYIEKYNKKVKYHENKQ
jgi:hypothetical protein